MWAGYGEAVGVPGAPVNQGPKSRQAVSGVTAADEISEISKQCVMGAVT
jgi:hypothetical protein